MVSPVAVSLCLARNEKLRMSLSENVFVLWDLPKNMLVQRFIESPEFATARKTFFVCAQLTGLVCFVTKAPLVHKLLLKPASEVKILRLYRMT